MSLAAALNNVHENVVAKIDELIESGLGVQHPNYNEKVLDLRIFRIEGRLDCPYDLEVLFSDNYSVEYISSSNAYNENGDTRYVSDVLDASLESLCEALDVLEQRGYPQYNVVLRAIVDISKDDLPEGHEFDTQWDVYDHENNDGELKIRLDTVVTVSASNKAQAVETAKANPPALGLENIDSCLYMTEFWVDTDQADNVELAQG
jgi:hypothetical protein